MSDDCANHWGCTILNIDTKRSPSTSTRQRFSSDESGLVKLKTVIASNCGPFRLFSTHASGTGANCAAIVTATGGRTDACLFACGSYVGGDNSIMQLHTSSDFAVQCRLALIIDPIDATCISRRQTIALPYFITTSNNELEDKCLGEIHIRCILAKVNNRPIRSIFLELMLCGCGALLSHRFLERLAALSEQHDFFIIVDEIMTAGRSGTMLMTQQQPSSFLKRVLFITQAKWTQVGLLLINSEASTELSSISGSIHDTRVSRGVSAITTLGPTIEIYKEVLKTMASATARREQLITKLKVTKEDCWGIAGVLYTHKSRTDAGKALKCRFLPLLHVGLKFDTFKTRNDVKYFSRLLVCATVKNRVELWLLNSQCSRLEGQEVIERPFSTFVSETTLPTSVLGGRKDVLTLMHASQNGETCKQKKYTLADSRLCLEKFISKDLIKETQKGAKRTHVLEVIELMCKAAQPVPQQQQTPKRVLQDTSNRLPSKKQCAHHRSP